MPHLYDDDWYLHFLLDRWPFSYLTPFLFSLQMGGGPGHPGMHLFRAGYHLPCDGDTSWGRMSPFCQVSQSEIDDILNCDFVSCLHWVKWVDFSCIGYIDTVHIFVIQSDCCETVFGVYEHWPIETRSFIFFAASEAKPWSMVTRLDVDSYP